MEAISPKLESLLRLAVNTSGSYKSEETLLYIQGELTISEYNEAESFLKWCIENKRTFGWNLPEVWMDWQESKTN